MHNRARMITASFLTKDLYIDWRAGARHFMTWLVDGDTFWISSADVSIQVWASRHPNATRSAARPRQRN